MSQFSDKGYIVKTKNDFYGDLVKQHKGIDPSWRLEASTPDGQKILEDSNIFANFDEAVQHCYDARNPNAAQGYDLDVLAAINGVFRREGTFSTVKLKVTGEIGTIILVNSLFDSGENTPQFRAIEQVTIPNSKTIELNAVCTERGAIEASIGSITRTPVVTAGVTSVTNEAVAEVGEPQETDAQLRVRRLQEVSRLGSAQLDSVVSAIYEVEGVQDAMGFENVENTTDSRGLEGHSTAFIVDGGNDEAVARAIFAKRSTGIPTKHLGAGEQVTKNVYDLYPLNARDINLSRPEYIDMNVSIIIERGDTFPDSAVLEIKAAILQYVSGQPINGAVYRAEGYKIGETVAVSELSLPITLVLAKYRGSYIEDLKINSKDSDEHIDMLYYQKARFLDANIGITRDDSD